MLQPKRTKFRRSQKGRMKGNAQRGNQLAFGSFGIKALEEKWIEGRQIEAARVAVTRYMQRQGQISRLTVFRMQWQKRLYVLQHRNYLLRQSLWLDVIIQKNSLPAIKFKN